MLNEPEAAAAVTVERIGWVAMGTDEAASAATILAAR